MRLEKPISNAHPIIAVFALPVTMLAMVVVAICGHGYVLRKVLGYGEFLDLLWRLIDIFQKTLEGKQTSYGWYGFTSHDCGCYAYAGCDYMRTTAMVDMSMLAIVIMNMAMVALTI